MTAFLSVSEQEAPQDDPKQRQPDIALAQESLGWQPSVSLREGLISTIVHFDRLLSGAQPHVNGATISAKPRRLPVANGRRVPSRLGQGEAADPTP